MRWTSIVTQFRTYTYYKGQILQSHHHVSRYENRSPLGLLNGVLLSYLLFSTTLCPSVAGACLVGAGSPLASWLGDPEGSVLGGFPLPLSLVEAPIVAED
jgi:hypothetical protein